MYRRATICAAMGLLCVIFGTVAAARPSLLEAINSRRAAGCESHPGVSTPLRLNRKLNAVARHLADGDELTDALAAAGYRAKHSASLFVSGEGNPESVARTLAHRSCAELTHPQVREIGIERRGSSIWIVIAAPFGTPALADPRAVSSRILELTNEARSRPRRCGQKLFPAAPPLKLVSALSDAAREHARDMARHSLLSHQGSDGSTPALRVTRAHYAWRTVGENVASGPTSVEEVMAGWLASPHHCENLMSPRFADMGVAFVVDPKSRGGVYWAQVFGALRATK